MKILVISTCKEKMHELEFVKPIEEILCLAGVRYVVKHYKRILRKELDNASKVIVCGTSLKDNEFIKNITCFRWIKTINKPILVICAGMQIMGMVFGGKIKNKTEIGFYREIFNESFLGLNGDQEVYHLHNNYIDFGRMKEFGAVSGVEISQAVKHINKNIYGVLFHPEVRNKKLIEEFVNL